MLKYIIILTIYSICSTTLGAQTHLSGFYIVLEENKQCTNPFKTVDKKLPHCLSREPIVKASEFENVSKLIADTLSFSKRFTIKISEEGFERLQVLTKKIPKIALVLVVDETIVGVFENIGSLSNPIPIVSNLYSNDINWIYDRLKK
jgi:hypothetical protein